MPATGDSATPGVAGVPAGAGEVVIDVVAVALGAKVLTPDSPQQLLWDEKSLPGGQNVGGAGSALGTEVATDLTMSWTLDKGRKWAIGAVALKPGTAATPPGTDGATMYYYHNDHLGTPQRLTDVSGVVVWSANYEPFGDVLLTIATVSNNLRFPGQYFDQETGLNYNYFRDYDPSIGRYTQSDPVGLGGGLNLYAYANLNPANTTDPLGLPSNPFQPLLERLGRILGRGASDKIVGKSRAEKCESEFCKRRIFAPTIDKVSEVCLKLSSSGDFGSGKFNECLSGCLERTKSKEYQKRCTDGQSCIVDTTKAPNA